MRGEMILVVWVCKLCVCVRMFEQLLHR